MKTTGMKHQLEALRAMRGRAGFALLMEQGTGKTWCLMADAERLYASGLIDAMVVVAPKGVHTNWVRREIPTHMDDGVIARAWKSGANKRYTQRLEDLLRPRQPGEPVALRVFAINIDAIMTAAGFAFLKRFMLATRCVFVIDESSRIKNPKAKRTERIMALAHRASFRRIATGTPITNAPSDVFSQFEFLEHGLLGTTSHRAFVAEYAELVDFTDVTHEDHFRNAAMLKRNPKLAFAQVVEKDEFGAPKWRNLDKLQRLLEPHSFRVLKRDCLELPEKVYTQVYFDLSPAQDAAYKLMAQEARLVLEERLILDDDTGRESLGGQDDEADGCVLQEDDFTLLQDNVVSVARLAAIVKLQQITSGFVMRPNGDGLLYVSDANPRLDALLEAVSCAEGKVIVWARFKEELRAVAEALRAAGRIVVEYHGGVAEKDREAAVDDFQNGAADAFVGQPQSGGIGLTLTAANTVIYYSNDYNSETRKQSEDRAHRIGTKRTVLYIDLIATGTIDEHITRALRTKSAMAAAILGDQDACVSGAQDNAFSTY